MRRVKQKKFSLNQLLSVLDVVMKLPFLNEDLKDIVYLIVNVY